MRRRESIVLSICPHDLSPGRRIVLGRRTWLAEFCPSSGACACAAEATRSHSAAIRPRPGCTHAEPGRGPSFVGVFVIRSASSPGTALRYLRSGGRPGRMGSGLGLLSTTVRDGRVCQTCDLGRNHIALHSFNRDSDGISIHRFHPECGRCRPPCKRFRSG